MAKPNRTPQQTSRNAQRNAPATVEIVDPGWLARMFALLVLVALFCGYLTLGLLFYLGSWQLVLHPTRQPNGGTGLPSEKLRFAVDDAGRPQLGGEWLSAGPQSTRKSYTVLYLRGADGQLDRADGTQIAMLHDAGMNVLAFDYRGYGESEQRPHPSEANMLLDAEAAWRYLVETRKVSSQHVLVFGNGIGVSLASQLLQRHTEAAGLIGYNADPSVMARIRRDPRSKLFPLPLVFHNAFRLDTLNALKLPKLLYTVGPLDSARVAAYQNAADPKLTVEVQTHDAAQEQRALLRFLGEAAPAGPAELTPQ